jgi:DNA-3-methyladenine glycosylase I
MVEQHPHRCAWANGDDALMAHYHDEEWGVPQRDSRMLWEMLMLEGFQAGLSWRTILHKREAFRKGFAGFQPEKVARFGPQQVESSWPTRASSARAPR